MSRNKLRLALAVMALAIPAVIGGCGIAPDDEAREVKPPPGPYSLGSPPATVPRAGTVRQKLCLLKDGTLVQVVRKVEGAVTIDSVMQALVAGPTEPERADGFATAIPGANVIGPVQLSNGLATVNIPTPDSEGQRTDVVYAYGQVVCTLTAQVGVTGVVFVSEAGPVNVPRGDGQLTVAPLTTVDYTDILTPTPSASP